MSTPDPNKSYGDIFGLLRGQNYGGYRKASASAHGSAAQQSSLNAFSRAMLTQQQALYRTAYGADTAEPPRPIEYAGIRAGEITAWRCWRLEQRLYLRSAIMDTVWAPGEVMTGVLADGYGNAGVHGWKTQSGVLSYGLSFAVDSAYRAGCPVVIGRIHLWGEVVEHERGYRGEYAKIISLDCIIGLKWRGLKRLRKLREMYGLPLASNHNTKD